MVVPALQLKKGYDRIKRATEERAAMRNAQDQERTRWQVSERGRSEKTKQVRLWAYSGPLMVAGFKDFLDLFLIGSSPLVGTVVTICCFLLIFFLFLIKDDLTVRMKPVFLFQAGGALMFATVKSSLIRNRKKMRENNISSPRCRQEEKIRSETDQESP
jgi:hypothetical protein